MIGFLRDKLPAPMAGQSEAMPRDDVSGLADLAGGLDGMFGNE